jgi:RNA polymerase sigma factor (sigma-70 family)
LSNNRKNPQPLRLVSPRASRADEPEARRASPRVRAADWAILMVRAQAGERDAYRRLLEEITPYVRSLAVKAHRDPCDVEDTVQDVLLTVHTIRHTYDPGRPFGPWLVAIAHRRIVDRLRRQGRVRAHETPLEGEHKTLAAFATNYSEMSVEAAELRDAIERLPPGQRDAVMLMKLQEMSLRQAAAVSGTSIAALKVATHRAMKSLRDLLTNRGSTKS